MKNGISEFQKPMKKTNENIDWGYIIRTASCVITFLIAAAYFSYTCSTVVNNYGLLFQPTSAAAISWFINFAISAALFIIMLGVTVALIRPIWIAMVTYAISAIMYVIFIGPNIATWITAGILFAILLVYSLAEVKLFKNQIKASTHPLGEKKALICTLLAVLLSVAVAVGYDKDATKRNFIIPPETETAFSQYLVNSAKTQIDAQKGTDQEKKAALEKATTDVKSLIEKQKEALKPAKTYIPYMLGISVFLIFQMILIFVGILSMIFVPLLFWILNITHFTHTITEQCEVSRLTLKSQPLS